jgi:hypothetical protein
MIEDFIWLGFDWGFSAGWIVNWRANCYLCRVELYFYWKGLCEWRGFEAILEKWVWELEIS